MAEMETSTLDPAHSLSWEESAEHLYVQQVQHMQQHPQKLGKENQNANVRDMAILGMGN